MVPKLKKTHSNCWAEIDIGALRHNVELLQKYDADTMAVLKADSYGHSTPIIAPTLRSLGIAHFGVATVNEGIELRQKEGFEQVAIYVMTATVPCESEAIVLNRLIPFVSSLDTLRHLQSAAKSLDSKVQVHLEIDTGIGRAGFLPSEIHSVIDKALRFERVEITGVCTHFTSGEDRNDAKSQHELFEQVLTLFPDEMLMRLTVHAANSPATLNVPSARYNMIRPGLLLYGIAPDSKGFPSFPFKPVLSLKAMILLIRDLPAGTEISYGRTYKLPHPARIATVGIGYGDGYSRRLTNTGQVLLENGMLAPIRGRVCMDQICVELPHGSTVESGDTVTLIGDVGDNSIRAVDLADSIGATPHEITTCLTGRVQWIAVQGSI